MKAIEIINKVQEALQKRAESKIQRYPRSTFIASDIVECERYLVYSVLDWDKREKPTTDIIDIMESGSELEKIILKQFLESGIEVVEFQQPFELKKNGEVYLRGKVDGKFKDGHERIPFEIKTVSENIFRSVSSYDDFKKKPYLKKYIYQTQLYLYGHEYEEGILVLFSRGHKKLLPVQLDYELCGRIVDMLERSWEYVKKREYPEKKKCEFCEICGFRTICQPDSELKEAKFVVDERVVEMLDEMEKLRESKERYEQLYEEVKKIFNEAGNYVAGNYILKVKESERKQVDTKAIPDEIKQQYMKVIKTRILSIEKK